MSRKWSEPALPREQSILLDASLDEKIGESPGLRFLDEFLRKLNWGPWEAKYPPAGPGRPPHHPRLVAGVILYGLMDGARSTRDLEKCSRWRIDYQWLLDGRNIDHSTFGKFRIRFEKEIQDLFVALNREAARLKNLTLEELIIDGTRLRADSDRHGARTAAALESRLKQLEERLSEALRKLEGSPEDREELERECAHLQRSYGKDRRALEVARDRDAVKQSKEGKGCVKVRVPVEDPDAHVLENKDGGYAPNYTPVIAVDGESGLIVAETIDITNTEIHTPSELVKEASAITGSPPERVLMDLGFASGEVLRNLEDDQVEVYVPLGIAAHREDPTQPVPQNEWDELPRRGKQLSREAFIYDRERDCYWCPMGVTLEYHRHQTRKSSRGVKTHVREYLAANCESCPLAEVCLSRKATRRTITRDEYEEVREGVGARTASEKGKKVYARRAPVVEGAFGTIKQAMNIRGFRRRGLNKVRADWTWICAAYNLKKLMLEVENAFFVTVMGWMRAV